MAVIKVHVSILLFVLGKLTSNDLQIFQESMAFLLNEEAKDLLGFALGERKTSNPVTTDGWRWKAPELMVACLNQDDQSNLTMKPTSGTLRFITPEPQLACGGEYKVILYVTKATDVWAFGMTLIEVCVSVAIFLCFWQADTNWLKILTESIPFLHIESDARVMLSIAAGGRPKRDHCQPINNEIWSTLEKC
jgi:serine/threonine protein kinase